MATSAKFPASLLALVDVGGELPGFPEATLSGAHNNSVTTITLTATVPTAWPTAGWVTIDSEIIQYAGKSGATLTSCTRGSQSAYGGSVAASHSDQAKVGFYLSPQAVNQIIVDLQAVQKVLFRPTAVSATGAMTIDYSTAGGSTQEWATTGNVTGITLSNPTAGQWYSLVIKYGGAHTIAFTTTIKWANGTTPTFTSVNGKYDVVSLFYNGTDWLGEFSANH